MVSKRAVRVPFDKPAVIELLRSAVRDGRNVGGREPTEVSCLWGSVFVCTSERPGSDRLDSFSSGTGSVLPDCAKGKTKGWTLFALTKLVSVKVRFSTSTKCASGGLFPVTRVVKFN